MYYTRGMGHDRCLLSSHGRVLPICYFVVPGLWLYRPWSFLFYYLFLVFGFYSFLSLPVVLVVVSLLIGPELFLQVFTRRYVLL